MSDSTFTPGPWHVGEGPQAQIVYDKDGWGVANATVFHRKHEPGSTLCNAKLIAAAPDLLEALQELRELMQGVIDGDYEPDSVTLQIADAAIAKATA